jgi:DNA-binding MarR family transcriptional regulator/N-acetylglutamate synthase-like GNAT family acetyltransferase
MTHNAESEQLSRIAAVRSFNRFYTRQIGLLQDGMHRSEFSLADARVLYELAHSDAPTATTVAKNLDLDPGYLSRIVAKLSEMELVTKLASATDRRQYQLQLTTKGRHKFANLDRGSQELVAAMLAQLGRDEQGRLLGAMRAIEQLLTSPMEKPPYLLRPHRAGDMGWVVARHGVLYAEEYGWDLTIEGLCAEIVGEFIRKFDAARECCWIAEVDGERAGCVFLVRETDEAARLRLLLVEPKARGLGIGRRLVDECIRFARQRGYKTITLWTHSILAPARRIYQGAGFRLVSEEHYEKFGQKLVGETWDLAL